MLQSIQNAIDEYRTALEAVHGPEYAGRTKLRYAGGADVVMEYPEGHRAIISIGHLELMTEHLQQITPRKAA